jgi:hypothetical protein
MYFSTFSYPQYHYPSSATSRPRIVVLAGIFRAALLQRDRRGLVTEHVYAKGENLLFNR